MVDLRSELSQQPQALVQLVDYYLSTEGEERLGHLPRPILPLLTGMGASYHVAWIGALMCQRLGIPALHIEATDLLHYSTPVMRQANPILYFSQSGSSGEVVPLTQGLDTNSPLVAITNHLDSPLAERAQLALPLQAGDEYWIASKTYVNSLALLWLVTRRWSGSVLKDDLVALRPLAERIAEVQQNAESHVTRLAELIQTRERVIFLGHGPHAATAREAAMTLAEWPKVSSLNFGLGAFRHGFIETVNAQTGIVIFAPFGQTHRSALALAEELSRYGASILLVENGLVRGHKEAPAANPLADEFLSPIFDILPVQLCAELLARQSGQAQGFRYINKVVKDL